MDKPINGRKQIALPLFDCPQSSIPITIPSLKNSFDLNHYDIICVLIINDP